MIRVIFFTIILILMSDNSYAETKLDEWYLPQELSDHNLDIAFEIDSTWHMVHGKTSGLNGKAYLTDSKDAASIHISVNIPVANFDTDNESRDEELREIMGINDYPDVTVHLSSLSGGCTPRSTLSTGKCSGTLSGLLKIKDVEKEVQLPITIESNAEGFMVSGSIPIKWSEYNVKDPSIFLIASVDPIVQVTFKALIQKVK